MVDISVFSVDINEIRVNKKENNFRYSFLTIISDSINVNPIYDLINSMETFKLKNIYQFLYLKLIIINSKFKEIMYFDKKIYKIKDKELDSIMNKYVTTRLEAIIITNLILSFFYPNKRLINSQIH